MMRPSIMQRSTPRRAQAPESGVYPTRESLIEMAREWLYEDPWASRNNGDTTYDDYDEDDYQINDYEIERS